MTALYTFTTKSSTQIRDDILRTISNGLRGLAATQGNPNFQPNVGQNSDYFIKATALGNELAVIHSNTALSNDQNKPTTATGADLDDWLNLMNVPRQGAAPAYGFATCPCSVTSTLIVQGTQLIDPSSGTLYQVQTTGSYGSTTPIPVIAVVGGSATDQPHGYALQWVTTPAFMQSVALVGATIGGSDGLSGGADSEVGVDGPPRARLLSKFRTPPTPGNSAQVIGWCTASSPLVQSAGVYPACLGPSTVFFSVWRPAQTSGVLSGSSKNRSLSATTVNSTVVPYVAGLYESGVFLCGVATTDQPCDIALQLTLPSSPSASPPGPGGGWLDGTPWPPSNGGTAAVSVTNVNPTLNQITLNASTTSPATPGVTHIAFLDPTTWKLNTATVTVCSGSAGAWVLTLDTAWPNVAVGNFVFPQSVNQQTYVTAALSAFGNLGAGEWQSAAPANSVSFRRPLATIAWPYSLDGRFLRTVEDSANEVESVTWLYRQYTTPTVPALPVVTVAANNFTGTLTATTLSGTIGVTNGSATVATGSSQVGTVNARGQVVFGAQPGVTYSVLSLTTSTLTLTTPYTGTTNASTTAVYTSGAPNVLVPRNVAFYPS